MNHSSPRSDDEGFSETREIPQTIYTFSQEQKTVNFGVSLNPHYLSKIVTKFMPLIRFDLISSIPNELSALIFDTLSYQDCCRASMVSKKWRQISNQDSIWRKLFISHGFQYNQTKVKSALNFLKNATQDDIKENFPNAADALNFSLWKYLFQQKVLIQRNWNQKKYEIHHLSGHYEGIYCVQFDNEKICSGSRDETIIVWNTASLTKIAHLKAHARSVLCLQYDDRYLISGSSDCLIIVWDINASMHEFKNGGKVLKKLKGHTDSVLNLKFNGNTLLSSSKDRTIRIWDIEKGLCVRILSGHMAAINSVMFSNDLIVSASGDRAIRVWDFRTGSCIHELCDHLRGIACIHFDGDWIVSGSSDKSIKVWNARTGTLMFTLDGHQDLVRTVQFDKHKIVSGSYDRSLKVWKIKNDHSASLMWSIDKLHMGRIFKLQYNDEKIVTCSQDKTLLILDFSAGTDARFF